MNREYYFFGNLFLGLSVLSGLFQVIIRFQFEAQVFAFQSFPEWFLVVNEITLVGSLFLLKYYHHKKFLLTFSTGIFSALSSFIHFIVIYIILTTREMEAYYVPTLLLTLGAGILYALALIFSNAGKKPWLKFAGVAILVLGLILVSTFVWSMNAPEIRVDGTLEKISQWASLASSLIPVLFIMNFVNEARFLNEDKATVTMRKPVVNLLVIGGLVSIAATLILGHKIATESYHIWNWNSKKAARAQVLAQPFEARAYVNSKGDTLLYRLLKPLNYDPGKEYPLVVCLHHGGAHGTDNLMQIEGSEPAQLLSTQVNREKYPAFVFVPQCPPGTNWGGISQYPSKDSLVFETISALEKEFSIDANRRYVTGISMGGYGSWHFISVRPTCLRRQFQFVEVATREAPQIF